MVLPRPCYTSKGSNRRRILSPKLCLDGCTQIWVHPANQFQRLQAASCASLGQVAVFLYPSSSAIAYCLVNITCYNTLTFTVNVIWPYIFTIKVEYLNNWLLNGKGHLLFLPYRVNHVLSMTILEMFSLHHHFHREYPYHRDYQFPLNMALFFKSVKCVNAGDPQELCRVVFALLLHEQKILKIYSLSLKMLVD